MEQFSYVRRGYDPEEVDKYVSTLEQVILSYKEKDNAIKNALISAEIAADNVVKNARLQADDYRSKIIRQLSVIMDSVERQRQWLRQFQDEYNDLVRRYLRNMDDSELNDLYIRLDEMDSLIRDLSETDIAVFEQD